MGRGPWETLGVLEAPFPSKPQKPGWGLGEAMAWLSLPSASSCLSPRVSA